MTKSEFLEKFTSMTKSEFDKRTNNITSKSAEYFDKFKEFESYLISEIEEILKELGENDEITISHLTIA